MLNSKNQILKIACVNYFDEIIKIQDFNLDNILIDEKSYENIAIYNISYKNLIAKLLHIRFDKIDGFIRVYDGTRQLVLFGSEKYNFIYIKIKCKMWYCIYNFP